MIPFLHLIVLVRRTIDSRRGKVLTNLLVHGWIGAIQSS